MKFKNTAAVTRTIWGVQFKPGKATLVENPALAAKLRIAPDFEEVTQTKKAKANAKNDE